MRLRSMFAALMVAAVCGGLFFARDLLGAGKYHDPGVDLLLVLAADISGSVDVREQKLQREGYAAGITDPEVLAAIEAGPYGKIAVAFVEWGDAQTQLLQVDWSLISDRASAERFADKLPVLPQVLGGSTAIGAAIEYATALFERSPYRSHRRVVDISGDGRDNVNANALFGARTLALEKRIVINGLVIGGDTALPPVPPETSTQALEAYYYNNVIGGPGSFVVVAENFNAFATAVRRKLVLEIAMRQEGR